MFSMSTAITVMAEHAPAMLSAGCAEICSRCLIILSLWEM